MTGELNSKTNTININNIALTELQTHEFQCKNKNLGKLANNEIDISNFTVLSGSNSGKSFISKVLYSIIKALRANHAKAYLTEMFSKLGREIQK